MASTPEKTYVRREHRFCLTELRCLEVTISRTDEIPSAEYAAELVDFSRKGMKLKVPIGLRFEETINVRLKFEDFDIWYEGVASVRHIRAEGDHSWIVGCALEPAIRDEIIAKLASSSGKERRAHARFLVEGVGTIQRQGDTKKGLVTLRNVSEGGFCVDEEDQHEPGDVVKLEIEDKNLRLYTIGACVRWQSESDNGYITGLSFTEAGGFENLMACVSRKSRDKSRGKRDQFSRFVLLAALLTMIVPPALSIVLQSRVSATQTEKTLVANTELNGSADIPLVDATQPQTTTPQPENNDPVAAEKSPRFVEPVAKPQDKHEPKPVVESQVPTLQPSTANAEPTAIAPESSIALSPMREWVDNSGQYRVTAELTEIGGDHIQIRKPDGAIKTVPLDRLSQDDLWYLSSINAN